MKGLVKKMFCVLFLVVALTMLSTVANADLVGYWKLDVQDVPGAGQTPDETGAYPGNYYGGLVPPGVSGNALYANGTSSTDYVRIQNTDGNLGLGGDDFTIATFIKFTTDAANIGWEMIMHATNLASGGGNSWNLMNQDLADGTRNLFIYADQGMTGLGNYAFATNQWYALAIVRSGASISSYIDGVLLATGAAPAVAYNDGDKDIFLGRNQHYFFNGNPWGHLEGALDEMRLYDNALTLAEIEALAIPEPATMALLLVGMGAVLHKRRQR